MSKRPTPNPSSQLLRSGRHTTSDAQCGINRQSKIGNWNYKKCHGGDSNSQTDPESIRGCSTCLGSELRDGDSFSPLGVAQFLALLSVSNTRVELQLEIRRFALSYAYGHDDVERVLRQDRASNQCSADRMIRAKYKSTPYPGVPGGRIELPTKGL
jgi:hypothetical protein